MGDVAVGQQPEVGRREVLGVADLDRVAEPSGSAARNGSSRSMKSVGRREGRLVERAELEDQRPDPVPVGPQPPGEEALERLGVEEVLVPSPARVP